MCVFRTKKIVFISQTHALHSETLPVNEVLLLPMGSMLLFRVKTPTTISQPPPKELCVILQMRSYRRD